MFEPLNRYIQIELEQPSQNETASGVLLPEDFKPTEKRHATASVVSWSDEVRFAEKLSVGMNIVIDKSMIENVECDNSTLLLILDNYVLGLIT